MTPYTNTPPGSNRTDRRFNPGRRQCADFARQAGADAFGWRPARELDQDDFLDRQPNELPNFPRGSRR